MNLATMLFVCVPLVGGNMTVQPQRSSNMICEKFRVKPFSQVWKEGGACGGYRLPNGYYICFQQTHRYLVVDQDE